MSISISGSQITFNDASTQTTAATGFGFKNRLINGGMGIWQRGTSFTASNTILYYADRWSSTQYAGSTASITQQASGLTGVSYCMRCQRAAGQTYTATVNMGQSVETQNSLDLAGNAVTFSFWARAGSNFSASSNILVSSIITGTGTDQNLFSTYTGSNRTDQNNTLTTSWQRFSMTITVPSNATEIAVLFNYAPTGTAGANDYFEFTLAQLEKGSTATSFDYRPYGTELQLCQRYYFNDTHTVSSGLARRLVSGYMYSSTQWEGMYFYPVEMRVAPTITFTAANTFTINNALTVSSIAGYLPNTRSTLLYTGNSAGTAGQGAGLWTTATNGTVSNIQFSAEL